MKKFFDVQIGGQENAVATYDTYEEAIIGLYKALTENPKIDAYIREYEVENLSYEIPFSHTYDNGYEYEETREYRFVNSYERDVLGKFNQGEEWI